MSCLNVTIDDRLTRNSRPVAELGLCHVRLMNDARFPWLLLIPARDGAVELIDLSPQDQAKVLSDINIACAALRAVAWPSGAVEKLNVAALGNMVAQLHIHVIGRRSDDPAWPGPVWGVGEPEPHDGAALDLLVTDLRAALTDTPANV